MGTGDVWFFDRIARIYDLAMPAADPRAIRAGLDRAGREVERVLDVGGGTGRGVRALDALERVVLDASRGMLRRVPPGIDRLWASATAIPLRGATVDAVLIVDALHHLPDAERVLAEARRVLRPGGVLVIREFDPGTLRGRLVEAGERLFGFGSTFRSPDDLAGFVAERGFDAAVVERGFDYTVAGRKPGSP